MNNILKENPNYIYFFHGTNESNEQLFFKKGLLDYKGGHLQNVTARFTKNIQGSTILEGMKNYAARYHYSNIVLVKIPFRILHGINRNNVPYVPLPIWKYEGEGEYGRIASLPPELIAGIYHVGSDTFVENKNYTTDFNPNGLCYDLLQIEHLHYPNLHEWLTFALSRTCETYDELLKADQKDHPFDELINSYKRQGIIQSKNTISSIDFLRWGIQRGIKIGLKKFKKALKRASDFLISLFEPTKDQRDD